MPTCNHCGRRLLEYDGMQTRDGRICMDCYRSMNYVQCSVCGNHFISEDGHRICDECEEKVYQRDINSYGTKPRPYFKNFNSKLDGKDTGCRYYGIEMEFNNVSPINVHELGKELYNEKFIYNKSDSSIGGGVEVVTSPMDRRVIPEFLKRMEPIFKYVGSHNYKSNAGLHVHVNKKTIDAIDRYKLNILLNNFNTINERKIMYYLSGRQTRLNEEINDHYFKIGTSSQLRYFAQGHGVALNTANKHTFEFRIFKTTNKPEEVMSYIELIDRMIDFCHSNGIKDISTNNFILYLKNNTNNEVILGKISTYEKEIGKLSYRQRIISTQEHLSKLHGLHWTSFYKLLSYMNNVRNLREYCNAIEEFMDAYNNNSLKLDSSWLIRKCQYDKVEKLKETIRVVLINKIKQQRKDTKKKCA